jgi:hypothetical protein
MRPAAFTSFRGLGMMLNSAGEEPAPTESAALMVTRVSHVQVPIEALFISPLLTMAKKVTQVKVARRRFF